MPDNLSIGNEDLLDSEDSLYQVVRRVGVDAARQGNCEQLDADVEYVEVKYGCSIEVVRPYRWMDGGIDQY